ncbi:MAG: hypothetical protein RIC55_29790 [Pirellulaceae bacterium]
MVSLYGVYNNGPAEENVLVEKLDDKVRLRAWWATPCNDVWLIDASLSNSDLDRLWKTLHEQHAFDLEDESRGMSHAMTYWLTLKQGGRQHQAKVYGVGWFGSTTTFGGDSPISSEWFSVVAAILQLRGQLAHLVRPAGLPSDGRSVWTGNIKGEVLVAELSAQQVAVLDGTMPPLGEEELSWATVLEIGRCRNREIVAKIACLLDDSRADVSAAACAVMSWISGQPPDSDRKHWKDWWESHAGEYQPSDSSFPEIPCGQGVIKNLGGAARGFVGVETGDDGNVWALVTTHSDWDHATYRLFKLDRRSDEFLPTPLRRSYASKSGTPPPVRFFRRVEETAINFPRYNNGLWAAPNGKWGAAILGQESSFHSDAVVVLDFEKGAMRGPLRTDHQYAAPVVSSNGAAVAVAKGWNWANPNSVVVIDTATGDEQLVPIPPADSVFPIAFVENSAHGPGYYLMRAGEGSKALWWCSPLGGQAKQLLVLTGGLNPVVYGEVNVTIDGLRIFTSRAVAEGHGREYGWMQLPDGDFEPVIPSSMWPMSVDATSDGNRVVFVDQGKVFEWRRSTEPPVEDGRKTGAD